MEKIKRESSIHQIVESINSIIDSIELNMSVLNTLNTSELGQQVVFTSSESAMVTGEVFTVSIPGMYSITTSGSGKSSILIQPNGQDVTETKVLYSNDTSEEFLLSVGDKLLFYASSDRLYYSVSLNLTKGLFSVTNELLIKERDNETLLNELRTQITSVIGAYTKQYEELTESSQNLLNYANEQILSMNNAINDLSDRITQIQGQL